MNSFLQAIKGVMWPQRCIFCGDVMFENPENTCESCKENLPYVEGNICFNCGREKKECTCNSSVKYYDKVIAPFYYEKDVRRCIHSIKFKYHDEYIKPLSEHMYKTFLQRYADEEFDFITYVPLYKKDLKSRSFNQSEILAKCLSEKTGIPVRKDLIKKIYPTKKQSKSDMIERYGNVLGVFDIDRDEDLTGMRVLLVDDIETTGATLSECGKMLFLAGAQKVCCISAAVTKKKGRD